MNVMKVIFIAFALTVIPISAFAEKMVDLGEYEIEGQIRKPSIQWIETQKKINLSIQNIFEAQLESLEKELLTSEQIKLGAQ